MAETKKKPGRPPGSKNKTVLAASLEANPEVPPEPSPKPRKR